MNDYLASSKWFKHIHKQFAPENGVDFAFGSSPAIDPYFLGIWIGDGTKSLRGVQISKPDIEIEDECKRMAASFGGHFRRNDSKPCPSFSIVRAKGERNYLLDRMRGICGDGEFPELAKTAPRSYRQSLLAGIIDTDGYIHNGSMEIVQKNKSYADGIAFVARSLGLRVHRSVKVVNGVDYQRLSISGDFSSLPTRIARKTAGKRKINKVATRTGFSVDEIGYGEYAGFELSGDGRFLLGDFTVTHNTAIASAIFSMARAKGRRVGFCVPYISLINQTWRAFTKAGLPESDIGIIQADHQLTNWTAPIQICSIETLNRRKILPDLDLIIFDEAHRQSKLYARWMAENPDAFYCGLSATPWAKGMHEIWDRLLVPTSMGELISQGYLSPYRFFAPASPDLSGVKVRAGDYAEDDLAKAMNKPKLIADIVTTWLEKAEGRRTFVFAVDRAHAKQIQTQFIEAGVKAEYIDAYTDVDERDAMLAKLAAKEIDMITSVGCLTTGVDCPQVDCMILARPTRSEMLYIQMVGRVLRIADGKTDALILDHSDTGLTLGLPDEIHYDQFMCVDADGERKAREAKEPLPKKCGKCGYLKPAKVHQCPCCGFVPEAQSHITYGEGELAEVGRGGAKQKAATRDEKQRFWSELQWLAKERGKTQSWVNANYRDKFGVWARGLNDSPAFPRQETFGWIKHKQIAWAKRKEKERAGVVA
jgi:superfamily II DNA or RNA helicase